MNRSFLTYRHSLVVSLKLQLKATVPINLSFKPFAHADWCM